MSGLERRRANTDLDLFQVPTFWGAIHDCHTAVHVMLTLTLTEPAVHDSHAKIYRRPTFKKPLSQCLPRDAPSDSWGGGEGV